MSLQDVLDTMRLRGTIFFVQNLRAPGEYRLSPLALRDLAGL